MTAARIRIGRVTMKNGGADVRVLHSRAADTECRDRVRSWASHVLSDSEPPQAFFAVAYRVEPDGDDTGLGSTVAWYSSRPEIPIDLLPSLAQATINRMIVANYAEGRTMRALGYTNADDPDPAA